MIPCPICDTRNGIHGFSWEFDRRVREEEENVPNTDRLPPPSD